MRRFLAFMLLGVTLLFTLPVQAQSRSLVWERWDVTLNNFDLVNNAFTVQEMYSIRFSGSFSFGTAVIPNTNLDQINSVVVYQDNIPLQNNCSGNAGTYCVQNVVEGTSITYYFFSPINSATGNFILQYRVEGALRAYPDGDQLWWTAVTSDKYGFSVLNSTITVELPAGYAPRETIDPIVTYGAPGEITLSGTTITAIATQGVGATQAFEIRAQYPHAEGMRVANWQADFDERRAFEENTKPLLDLGLVALSLIIAIVGPMGVYILWYTRGRDPKIGPVPTYLTDPPSDLPPAVVGSLIDERVDTRDILSTIIDLARRGYLVIQEDKKAGLFGLNSSTFAFKRTDKPTNDLRGYERAMVDHIFGNRMERSLNDLKDKFYQYLPGLKDDLSGELVTEKLFDRKPSTTRAIYMGWASFLLIATGLIGFLAMGASESLTGALLCVPFSMGLSVVGLFSIASFMPVKTRKGAEEAAKWSAFKEYLQNLEKYDSAEGVAEKFDKFLPYAIAFGMERTWIHRFSKVTTTPMPMWYYPTYYGGPYSRGYTAGTPMGSGLPHAGDVMPGDIARAGGGGLDQMAGGLSGGLENMANGLSSMLESASRTLTSTPAPSNSGSSGSWGGGGSSWSGGGSSGGGGSGGGSRGFG